MSKLMESSRFETADHHDELLRQQKLWEGPGGSIKDRMKNLKASWCSCGRRASTVAEDSGRSLSVASNWQLQDCDPEKR